MQDELNALNDNKTWSIVPLPKGQKVVGVRWIYKIKFHSNCTIERYKASRSRAYSSMFIRNGKVGRLIVLVYVEDLIITGDDAEEIKALKSSLHATFSFKDLGMEKVALTPLYIHPYSSCGSVICSDQLISTGTGHEDVGSLPSGDHIPKEVPQIASLGPQKPSQSLTLWA
ncbi:uncharacterized protein LOC126797309 [Argentina anserina]|uniref:uncharacterized protein LOC126797309 n=1 Tax=Argentina anserina TaxID=57926 RepID=UPI0021761DE4|nr:uncharacterized protein LOC126797309 [Potentilla anserina]